MKLVNPEQPAQVRGHRRRHRPRRRRRPPRRSASSATRSRSSPSTTRPGGRTRSPPRAASTPPRTTRATATRVHRLFYDTVKGGDFRAREANVYRLAEVSVDIIDQWSPRACPSPASTAACSTTAPSAARRCRRTFYARGQTGQQLLLGAYQPLVPPGRRSAPSSCTPAPRCSTSSSRTAGPRGIVARDLVTGEVSSHSAHAVRARAPAATATSSSSPPTPRLATSPATWRAHRKGALFANPCYTQIHPTCIPAADEFQSKLTLMSESLRNDGRIWVPEERRRHPVARPDPRGRARLLPRAHVPELRQPRAPRRRRPAPPSAMVDERPGRRPAEERRVPRLRRRDRPPRRGRRSRSATATSSRCTSASPTRTRTKVPMRIYPAVHYTMGGLWVDYDLMTQRPRPVRARRGQLLRPRRQPPRRLGAHAGPGRRLLRAAATRSATTSPALLGTAPVPDRRPRRSRRRSRSRRRPGQAVPVDRRHAGPSTTSTASSARSCGTTAAWPATRPASRRRSRRSRRCARSSGRTCACSATATAATRRSRRPAASPTSSSSAS